MSGPELLLSICITLFVLCSLAGMVKFYQAVKILMKGRPEVDKEIEITEEDFQEDE